MYLESKVPLAGEPLHNKHLNYYKHPENELMERLNNRFYKGKDTRPVHVPSRLHAFLNINDYIETTVDKAEVQGKKPECAIFVNEPDTTTGKNVLSVCNEISQYQDVTDLWLSGVQCGTMLETGGLALSSSATSCILDSSSLPSNMLNQLMERVSESSSMKLLSIQFMSLKPLRSLISNKKYLQHLELKGTSLSPDLCQHICQQMENLEHLRHLDFSHNNLSKVSSLLLSNNISLTNLELMNTSMSPELAQNICEQMSHLIHLQHLNLSFNKLTGCLTRFKPEKKFEDLRVFWLMSTVVNKDDIFQLTEIFKTKKLPNLQSLMFKGTSFVDMTQELEEFISTYANNHFQKLQISLRTTYSSVARLRKLTEVSFIKLSLQEQPDVKTEAQEKDGMLSRETKHVSAKLKPNPESEIEIETPCDQNRTESEAARNQKAIRDETKTTPDGEAEELPDTLHQSQEREENPPVEVPKKSTKLILSGVKVDENIIKSFLQQHLEEIRLKNCEVPQDLTFYFIPLIGRAKHITVLDFSETSLGPNARNLVNGMQHWQPGHPLQELYLTRCNIFPEFCAAMLVHISKCQFLTHLDLSANGIGKHGIHLVDTIQSWGPRSHLKTLNLSNCFIPQEVSTKMMPVLGRCQALTHLWLPGNTLTGCIPTFLEDPNPGIPGIPEISLCKTGISRDDLVSLAKLMEEKKLPKLKVLDLRQNNLNQNQQKLELFLEAALTNQNSLYCLDFQQNCLSVEFKDGWRKKSENAGLLLVFDKNDVMGKQDEQEAATGRNNPRSAICMSRTEDE